MKFSKLSFAFILGILIIGTISAVDIEIKDSVKLGENFIVKISGVFLNKIQESQVKFYRQEHIPTEMGKIKIEEINSDYYFYLMIPLEKKADDYKIVIENVKYKSGINTITGDISANFKIENETAAFSINPPLIIASGEYSVEVQNLLTKSITIDLEKKIKIVESNTTEENTTEDDLSFFDILFGRSKKTNETVEEESNTSLITGQVITSSPIILKSGEIKILTFLAPKEGTIEKLELYYGEEVYAALVYNPIKKEIIIVDEDNETKTENTTEELNETIEEIEELNETDDGNYTNIEITEDGSIVNKTTNETIGSIYKNCADNNGAFCKDKEEICLNNEKVQSLDGFSCCLSSCVQVKKTSTGKIIGWSIIGVIALFLAWFFKQKYSRAGPGPINFASIASGKK